MSTPTTTASTTDSPPPTFVSEPAIVFITFALDEHGHPSHFCQHTCTLCEAWARHFGQTTREVTGRQLVRMLKTELGADFHTYYILVFAKTVCGKEGGADIYFVHAFFDVFGEPHESLKERGERAGASLVHSTRGLEGWFWGFLEQGQADNVLRDAKEDGSFVVFLHARQPSVLRIRYISWATQSISEVQMRWGREAQGMTARYVQDGTAFEDGKLIGSYERAPHLLQYLASAKKMGKSFPTSPLSFDSRPEVFQKKKDEKGQNNAAPSPPVTATQDGEAKAPSTTTTATKEGEEEEEQERDGSGDSLDATYKPPSPSSQTRKK